MSGWWANKLSQQEGAPPRTPAPPPNPNLPPGFDPQAAVNRYVEQYAPAAAAPIPPQFGPAGASRPYAPAGYAPGAGSIDPNSSQLFKDAMTWQGNPEGGASEHQTCPSCHGSRFFSRRSEAVFSMALNRMVEPSAECMECGYPRKQGTLGVPAKVVGAQTARQAASPDPRMLSALPPS